MKRKTFLWSSIIVATAAMSIPPFFGYFIPGIAGTIWMLFVAIANLVMEINRTKKKRRRETDDTLQGQVERTINFAETQIKF